MGRNNYKALIVLLCCCIASCVKDKPAGNGSAYTSGANNVFIVCEGNFGSGNASLYTYQPADSIVAGDLYEVANGQPLGDVLQSMVKIDGRYFLCVNNSDKVVVVNAANLVVAGIISIPKPRYILPVSATKAYVSALYSNKVYVINTQTLAITDTIILPAQNPEGMCLYDSYAFICTWDTADNHIYKVDVTTNKVVQPVTIAGYAAQEVVMDKEHMLWVLSGNKSMKKECALTRVDPSTGDVLSGYRFASSVDALKPVFNPTKDTLYFTEVDYLGGTANNGIYRMGIHDADVPTQPFVAAKAFQYFWALGIEPGTGMIYAGDPKGFIQKGTVYVYKQDGTQVRSFDVGLGPGHFYFEY